MNSPANPNPRPVPWRRSARLGRTIAIATAIVFLISSVFPVLAGLSKNTALFPKWFGPLDVILAFLLAVMAFMVMALAEGKVDRQVTEASYRAYRVLIHVILAMTVVFFLAGDRIVWIQCITGFAWRFWLLLYCLPAWLATVRPAEPLSPLSK